MIKQIVSSIRNYLVRRLGIPEIAPAMERLSKQAFEPNLILDVGAYHGEYAHLCRRVWPNSFVVCIEPQSSAVKVLESRIDNKMAVYNTLLGAEERNAVPFREVETASSVLVEHIDKSHPVVLHPMRTIDSILSSDFDGQSIDLLKLDVQGYELEILKGGERSLKAVQVILVEVNLLDIHEKVPLLSELVTWLKDRNFIAFDICGLTRRPLDQALWQADMLFVQEDSPLRRDKRWAV